MIFDKESKSKKNFFFGGGGGGGGGGIGRGSRISELFLQRIQIYKKKWGGAGAGGG